MKIAISAESTIDLPKELLEKYQINILPYTIILGDKEYLDGEEISPKQIFDYVKETKVLPKTAKWRYREDGDIFQKFGGGTKKLKSFLIDRKVPSRIRDFIPVLADGNEVFVIAGVEISEKVRVDDGATTCVKLKVEKSKK